MKKLRNYLLEYVSAFNIARNAMPQITDQEKFASYLENHGIRVSKAKVDVDWLKPIQVDIDQKKVECMVNQVGTFKPIIVSDMFYILDGHHRYFSHLISGTSDEIDVIQVDLGINKLLIMADEFLND